VTKDAFEARRVAFEEEYFRKKDAQLIDKLKAVFHKSRTKEELRQATGIADEAVLDTLVGLNVNADLLAAFELYPLIEVAWADGGVDERERLAVLDAADRHGVVKGSAAYAMLDDALRSKPRPDAAKAWYLFAEELRNVLSAAELERFRDDLMEYARTVAASTGGLLSIAFSVTSSEKEVLRKIESALTR